MNFSNITLRFSLLSNLVFGLIFSANVMAQEDIKNLENIKKAVVEHVGGIGKFNIQPSQIKGLYLVIAPPRVLYISEDAKYIIDGDIKDIKTGQDFTGIYRTASISAAIKATKDTMITFSPPKGKIKHTVSVFTDMDCYYCQKLHKEMAEYNRLGIEIRYLAYPRQGLKSPAYKKSVSVWCSKDQKAALTKAKNGEKIKSLECKNPVAEHFALGQLLGLSGTPALLLENGQIHSGYVPAADLKAGLDRFKNSQTQ